MRIVRLLLFCLVLLCFVVQAQAPQNARPITQIFNEDGWEIPGLRDARIKPGTKTGPASYSVEMSHGATSTLLVPKLPDKLYDVPIITIDSAKQRIVYRKRRYKVIELRRFEVNGKPYCFQVSGMIFSEDPRTKVGGWAGEIEFLYFDESGSGVWTIMDPHGLVLPEIPKPPEWALKK